MSGLEKIRRAMSIVGLTNEHALTLMLNFIRESQKTTQPTGQMIEFGTYVGRVSMLMGLCARHGELLNLVDQAGYLDEQALNEEKIKYVFHKGTSERYVSERVHATVNVSHHDASHFFKNVTSELSGIVGSMDPNGLMILDDFTDPYGQVRAAFYYLRYKEDFPWELAIVGYGKAVLVHEARFGYWENYILESLQDEMLRFGVGTVLYRTDMSEYSRGFYIRASDDSEPKRYGLNIWGDRFYKPCP